MSDANQTVAEKALDRLAVAAIEGDLDENLVAGLRLEVRRGLPGGPAPVDSSNPTCVHCGGATEGPHTTVWIGPEAHHKECAATALTDRPDPDGPEEVEDA